MKRVVSWVLKGQFQRALGFFLKTGLSRGKGIARALVVVVTRFFSKK